MPKRRGDGRDTRTYRAGVIGHTGRGNYGHGLDVAFVGLEGVELAALADPDAAGRAAALERSGAARGYADYREMLAEEALDLVAVGPYDLDQHEEMVVAAARAGAKAIYCEKPIARALDEADRMLEECGARGVKLAVAHQNRGTPAPRLVRRLIGEGKIGRLHARAALEMIMAVYESHLRGGRVVLPMARRTHPLGADARHREKVDRRP